MQQTELKFSYNAVTESECMPVIVVAAGASSRMNGINKQLVELKGMPVIVRTLKKFDECPFISNIILVTRKEDILKLQILAEQYDIKKLTDIVEGGENRHASVMNGIARIKADQKKVLIHDGARPFVNNFIIGNVTAALQNSKAVICAVPVADTVKRSDENKFVCGTVDRTDLYLSQTPQGIYVSDYKSACESVENAEDYTDDAAIMEAAGFKVQIVAGNRRNIKITTPDDLELAECYLTIEGE